MALQMGSWYYPQWVLDTIADNDNDLTGISCEGLTDEHEYTIDGEEVPLNKYVVSDSCGQSPGGPVRRYPAGPSYTMSVTLTFPYPITDLPTYLEDTSITWIYTEAMTFHEVESVPSTFYVDVDKTKACTISGSVLDCPCKPLWITLAAFSSRTSILTAPWMPLMLSAFPLLMATHSPTSK